MQNGHRTSIFAPVLYIIGLEEIGQDLDVFALGFHVMTYKWRFYILQQLNSTPDNQRRKRKEESNEGFGKETAETKNTRSPTHQGN